MSADLPSRHLKLPETPGRRMKVLVGDSVFEQADVTIYDGHLRIDFEAGDLDPIDIDLRPLVEGSADA